MHRRPSECVQLSGEVVAMAGTLLALYLGLAGWREMQMLPGCQVSVGCELSR